MNAPTDLNTARHPGLYFIKRLVFLFLRLRQEITLYEGMVHGSDHELRLIHIGNAARGKAFVQGLFGGHIPRRRRLGIRFSWFPPRAIPPAWLPCDVLLVEANRLNAGHFRKAGFFTVPEWVEFGRRVVADPALRYLDAAKSLKSDLNKIRSSRFTVDITRDRRDFNAFYETMYLPHARQRFGPSAIIKGKRILEKDFRSGFLLLLKDGGQAVAGALVREEDDVITETTLGVLSGADDVLRTGVSGAIDYHLLDWAAAHRKRVMKVGHTRPFPYDGVYRNKRKWLMAISPDPDGVMDMAVQIRRFDSAMTAVLRQWPFVFQTTKGLALLCGYDGSAQAGKKEIKRLVQHYAVEGLHDVIVVSTAGYRKEAMPFTRENHLPTVHLFTDINQAAAWQLA